MLVRPGVVQCGPFPLMVTKGVVGYLGGVLFSPGCEGRGV